METPELQTQDGKDPSCFLLFAVSGCDVHSAGKNPSCFLFFAVSGCDVHSAGKNPSFVLLFAVSGCDAHTCQFTEVDAWPMLVADATKKRLRATMSTHASMNLLEESLC